MSDENLNPTTPVVKKDTPTSPKDKNEFLFDDEELAEDDKDELNG